MKKNILLLAILFSVKVFAQVTNTVDCSYCKCADIEKYISKIKSSYCCNPKKDGCNGKMVNNKAFDLSISKIFEKVLADNEGVVKNGKSVNFDQDNEKTSLSFSQLLKKENSNRFYNFYANGNTKEGLLYMKNGSSNNYGLSLGGNASQIIGSSQFFNSPDCDKFSKKRNEYLDYIKDSICCMLKFNVNQSQIDSLKKLYIKCKFSYNRKIKEQIDSIQQIMDFQEKYSDFNEATDLINSLLTDYELNNAPFTGYSAHWINGGADYSYSSINVFDTTVLITLVPIKQSLDKFTFYTSYNYVRNTKNTLFYFTTGIKIYDSYWIEGQRLTNYEFTDTLYNEKTTFQAYNNTKGNNNLSARYRTINPYLITYCFPFQKKIGIEAAFSLKIQPQTAPIYDCRLGFLYSVHNDDSDLSKGTFGLFLTLNNYDTSKLLSNKFLGIGFRAGLPFAKFLPSKK